MSYTEQNIPIQFAGGVETKMDSKVVPTTRLLALENGVFTKATTIVKRNGYTSLANQIDGDSEQYTSAKGLAARDNELLMFADDQLFSRRTSNETWSRVGDCVSLVETNKPIARTGTDQSQPDTATLDGVTLAAWEDSRGGVWCSIVEADSGRVLRAAEQVLSTGSKPRCVAVGDRLHLYYVEASANRIYVVVVDPGAYLGTLVPLVLADSLSATNPSYDACATTRTESPAFIAWASAAATQVAYVDKSGVVGSVVTGHPSASSLSGATTGPVAVAYDAAFAACNVLTTSSSEWTAYQLDEDDLTSSTSSDYDTGATIVRTAIIATGVSIDGYDGQALFVCWEHAGSTARDNLTSFEWINFGVSSVNSGPIATVRGHGICSRGFAVNGSAYVVVGHDVDFYPYLATLRLGVRAQEVDATQAINVLAVSRTLTGVADGLPTRNHCPSVSVDGDVATFAALMREQVDALEGDQFTETSVRLVSLDYNHRDAYQWVQYGRNVVIAGACPNRYDGDSLAELGFHTAPDGAIGVVESAGGALSASSTYLYVANYEEIDGAGEVHPGPVSIPITATTGVGEGTVTLTIPTYRLTSKRRVRICVWRSDANDTSGDPILYKVTATSPTVLTGNNRYLVNDTTVDTLTFIDVLSDADLLTKERLYTTGGVLSNDPVSLGSIVAQGKNRIFFNDPGDQNLIRYSQEKRDGIGAEISADLSIRVDDAGGAITGIGVLDDAVVVFKRSAIYFFAGPGPLANPDAAPNVSFSPPILIASDVGCTHADSIGPTPVGLMFQSDKGIYLLRRDRQVQYIGSPVEAYNSQTVRRCTLLPERTAILCLCDSGYSLLFDYFHQQWSTFTNHAGVDAVNVNGVYHYLRTDGRVFREDRTGYRDDNTQIRLTLATAWIKLTGYLQGMQKIWWISFLGSYVSPHLLRVRIQLDYERGWGAPQDLDVDYNYDPVAYGELDYGNNVYGSSYDTVYQRRIHVGAKCQAFRVLIEDHTNGTDELQGSFDLAEMLVTGGVMRGQNKLGPDRSTDVVSYPREGGGVG